MTIHIALESTIHIVGICTSPVSTRLLLKQAVSLGFLAHSSGCSSPPLK
jgi:hypothetical protein